MMQKDRIVGFLQSLESNGVLSTETQSLVLVPDIDYLAGGTNQCTNPQCTFNECKVNLCPTNSQGCTTNSATGCDSSNRLGCTVNSSGCTIGSGDTNKNIQLCK